VKLEFWDGVNWYSVASESYLDNKTISIAGAVNGSGPLSSPINTSLSATQNMNGLSLKFNWSNSGSFAEYYVANNLQDSSPPPQFVYDVLVGGSGTLRGWQLIFQPGFSSQLLTNFQIDYIHPVSGRLTPFRINTYGSSLRTYFGTTIDLQGNNLVINSANPVNAQDLTTKNYVDSKVFNINSSTSGQLNINRLSGYPANSSVFLRGDGAWASPTSSIIDINSGTTGQLNISRLSGYPSNSSVFLNGSGNWIDPLNVTVNASAYNILVNNLNSGATNTGLIIRNNGNNAVEFGYNTSTNEAYVWASNTATLKFGTNSVKRMDIANNSGKVSFYDPSYNCYIRPASNFLDMKGLNVYNSVVSTIIETNASNENSSIVMNGDFMQFINPMDTLGFIFTDEDNSSMTSYVAYINSSGQIVSSSKEKKHSIRKKEHKDYLQRLNKLNIYSYGLKYQINKNDSTKEKSRKQIKMNELQIGVIAEEVAEIFDNATNLYKPLDESKKARPAHTPSLGVNYNTIICYTILAVQELAKKVEFLERKLEKAYNLQS